MNRKWDLTAFKLLRVKMDLVIDSLPALAGLLEMCFVNLADSEVDGRKALPPKAALVFALNENFHTRAAWICQGVMLSGDYTEDYSSGSLGEQDWILILDTQPCVPTGQDA